MADSNISTCIRFEKCMVSVHIFSVGCLEILYTVHLLTTKLKTESGEYKIKDLANVEKSCKFITINISVSQIGKLAVYVLHIAGPRFVEYKNPSGLETRADSVQNEFIQLL